jgi:hypothetical protein
MFRFFLLALVAAVMAGCGSGGAGGSAVDGTAKIILGTRGGSTATVIGGIELTLRLPAGVTIAANQSGELQAGVLQPEDSGALIAAKYVPATASDAGYLRLVIVNSDGFPVGNFATINCSVSTGADLKEGSFPVDGFQAVDENTAVIPAISPYVVVSTK